MTKPETTSKLESSGERSKQSSNIQSNPHSLKNANRLVFLGPPASGKGTQGRRLADERDLAYLSTGGLLRGALREKSKAGEAARPYLEKGLYVPDEIMLPLVSDWLEKQNGGWILDGFPRTLSQAKSLDSELGESISARIRAVYLSVPHAELRRRVVGRIECEKCHWVSSEESMGGDELENAKCKKCGGQMAARADDDVIRFEKRYLEFSELTLPLVEYYLKSARLLEIDGSREPGSVAADLAAKLPCK